MEHTARVEGARLVDPGRLNLLREPPENCTVFESTFLCRCTRREGPVILRNSRASQWRLLGLPLFLLAPVAAAAGTDLVPGVRYDPNVPTLVQVVGHDFGEEITAPEQIARRLLDVE